MDKINPHYPVLPINHGTNKYNAPKKINQNGLEFKQIMEKMAQEIKFSGHCEKRMEQNNIVLSDEQKDKLSNVINNADLKGARDTFIFMDNMAFLVSIQNRTVITVVDEARMKENIFTNIDSAVIV